MASEKLVYEIPTTLTSAAAKSKGLIRLAELPKPVLTSMGTHVWHFSCSLFAIDGSQCRYIGTGTLVTVGGRRSLLTAAHVWRAVHHSFALSLGGDRILQPVPKDYVEAAVIGSAGNTKWGPDLAMIPLPDVLARQIGEVKAFYNVDRRAPLTLSAPDWRTGAWAVMGAPAEQSHFDKTEAVLMTTLLVSAVTSVHERDGHDYIDLSYYHENRPDLPQHYGGISGAGLWYLPITQIDSGEIVWSGDARLEGVAFYQEPKDAREGVIRCHGRNSVFGGLMDLMGL